MLFHKNQQNVFLLIGVAFLYLFLSSNGFAQQSRDKLRLSKKLEQIVLKERVSINVRGKIRPATLRRVKRNTVYDAQIYKFDVDESDGQPAAKMNIAIATSNGETETRGILRERGATYRLLATDDGFRMDLIEEEGQIDGGGIVPIDQFDNALDLSSPISTAASTFNGVGNDAMTLDIMFAYEVHNAPVPSLAVPPAGSIAQNSIMIGNINDTFETSGLAVEARLVHITQTPVVSGSSASDMLHTLRFNLGGLPSITAIHKIRDLVGADQIIYGASNGSPSGVAYRPGEYAVITVASDLQTVVHELGHNLGVSHAPSASNIWHHAGGTYLSNFNAYTINTSNSPRLWAFSSAHTLLNGFALGNYYFNSHYAAEFNAKYVNSRYRQSTQLEQQTSCDVSSVPNNWSFVGIPELNALNGRGILTNLSQPSESAQPFKLGVYTTVADSTVHCWREDEMGRKYRFPTATANSRGVKILTVRIDFDDIGQTDIFGCRYEDDSGLVRTNELAVTYCP